VPIKKRGSDRVIESEAYLIEAQTLEGLSGSPVFVQEYKWWQWADGDIITGFGKVSLLGVYQGAWDAQPGEVLAEDRNLNSSHIRVPVGMGVVVPIQRVIELIGENEALNKLRAEMRKIQQEHTAKNAATMDHAFPDQDEVSNPQHREDFNRLVSAASKSKPKGGRT
jgi:hypothetical protein